MEEKHLDFNAPLLSVRRFASPASSKTKDKSVEKFLPKKPSLHSSKPDLKSGPVRNPGTVPFVWEQIPGKPKDGSGSLPKAPESPPLVPKLPPGRTLDVKQLPSAKSAEKKEPEAFYRTRAEPQNDGSTYRPDVSHSKGNLTSLNVSTWDVKEGHSSDLEDYDDDAFSDAVDTLSHSESFFMNCSLSGLSHFEGPELKCFRRASMDPQARDFMMDRFLPAAKAVASEAPQYASRKKPVAREPLRSMNQVNNVDWDKEPLPFEGDKQPQSYRCKPYVIPQHALDEEEEDSDNDDEDYDHTGNLTAKACGMLPRFCLKNPLCPLNPVPEMKIRSRMPLSSVGHKVSAHVKTTGSGYLSEPDHESTWEDIYKHKLLQRLQPPVAENLSKGKSESNQLTYWSDFQTSDGSSPYRHSKGDEMSPFQNEVPQSPFHEGMGFLGFPRQGKNGKLGDLVTHSKGHDDDQGRLSHRGSKWGSGSSSPAIEKTLYVDSIYTLGTSISRSSSSDIKELISSVEKDSDFMVESERLDNDLILEAHVGETNQQKSFSERDVLRSKVPDNVDGNTYSCSEGSLLTGYMDDKEGFRNENALFLEGKSSECLKELDHRSPGLGKLESFEGRRNSFANSLQSSLPPLPKSPSESWLCRTLPSVSSMNPSSRSYLGTQFRSREQDLTASPVDPKWGIIKKTSSVQPSRLRFSEELKMPGSHPSVS